MRGFGVLTVLKLLPVQINSKDYLSFSRGLIYLPGDSVLSSNHEGTVCQGLSYTSHTFLQKQGIIF